MSMNIKDEAVHQLTRQLAAATGESLTTAVKVAVQERLERVRQGPRRRAAAEEILALGRSIASKVKGRPIDHGELLYDEYGLPK